MGRIDVRVSPKSSRNAVELKNGVIKVYVTAPPVDGEANEAVCKLVAARLGVPKTNVRVVRGDTSKTKTLEVEGLIDETILSRLTQSCV